MKKRLLRALARLASPKYQYAYIAQATSEEYVVPEDLVEDVASLCALASQNQYRSNFTAEQLFMLGAMIDVVKAHGRHLFRDYAQFDPLALIENNGDWIVMRDTARKCLDAFAVDVDKLSPSQIDSEA